VLETSSCMSTVSDIVEYESGNPFYLHRYLLRVPLSSLQIRQIVASVLRSVFVYTGLQLNFEKQLFVLNSYNPLYYMQYEQDLLLKGPDMPYVVITETQVQENYQPMFLGQLAGVGFNTLLYKSPEYTVPLSNVPNLYTADESDTIDTIQIRDFKISVQTTRLSLRISGYMYFATYDQLLDVQTSLTQLLVTNAMHYIEIPVSIVLPKTIMFQLSQTSDLTALVHLYEDRIVVRNVNVVGRSDVWTLDTVMPTYYRLETISDQSQLTVTQGQGQIFRLGFTFFVDTAVIKMYDISVVLPIKGCALILRTDKLQPVYASEVGSETNTVVQTVRIETDYQKGQMVIDIPESVGLNRIVSVSVTLYKTVVYTADVSTVSIAKDLQFKLDKDNRQIRIDEFVPADSVLKIRYQVI